MKVAHLVGSVFCFVIFTFLFVKRDTIFDTRHLSSLETLFEQFGIHVNILKFYWLGDTLTVVLLAILFVLGCHEFYRFLTDKRV